MVTEFGTYSVQQNLRPTFASPTEPASKVSATPLTEVLVNVGGQRGEVLLTGVLGFNEGIFAVSNSVKGTLCDMGIKFWVTQDPCSVHR